MDAIPLLSVDEVVQRCLDWLEHHECLDQAENLRVIDRTHRGEPEQLFRVPLLFDHHVPGEEPEEDDPFDDIEEAHEPGGLDRRALMDELTNGLVPEVVGTSFIRLQLRLMARGGRKQVTDGSKTWLVRGVPLEQEPAPLVQVAPAAPVVQQDAPELGRVEPGSFESYSQFQVLTGMAELRVLQREFMGDQARSLKNWQQAHTSAMDGISAVMTELGTLVAETHESLTGVTKSTYEGLFAVLKEAFDSHTSRHAEAQRESAGLLKELATLRGNQSAAVEDLRDKQDRRAHIDKFMGRVERIGLSVLANKSGIPEELVPVIEVLAESDELLELLKSPELRHLVTHASKEELAELAEMLRRVGAGYDPQQRQAESSSQAPPAEGPDEASPPPPDAQTAATQQPADDTPPPAPT